MKNRILSKLAEVAKENNVEILFAVESGSRAWGFASPDSDYDIRFVYKRKTENYLSLWEGKDTIQFMTEDDLDGSGWDIKKATKLLVKSNASFLGWLFSPIVYLDNGETLEGMKKLAAENFNPVAGFYHYQSMSRGFYDQLLGDQINLKSFFYAARTAFCANWILRLDSVPPVLFKDLFTLVDDEYADKLSALIVRKSTLKESGRVKVDHELKELLKSMLAENNNGKKNVKSQKPNYTDFDQFFIRQIT